MEKYLGEGKNGICYLDSGKVTKIYKNTSVLYDIPSEFVGLYNSTYVFPEKMIFDSNTGKRVAALFRYINSVPLDKKDISIDDIINSIDTCYADTDKLSKQGIRTFDVYPKNMLYDNGIKIIDIDYYYFSRDKDIYKCNIDDFNTAIMLLFTNELIQVKFPKLFEKDKILFDLYKQTFLSENDNKTLKELLLHLKKIIQEQEQKEIKMVSEYKKILSR